jgi:hypothetical protein
LRALGPRERIKQATDCFLGESYMMSRKRAERGVVSEP